MGNDGRVFLIEGLTHTVVRRIRTSPSPVRDHFPLGVAGTPNGDTVFVVNNTSSVAVIDTATQSITGFVELDAAVASDSRNVKVAPDGATAYMTAQVPNAPGRLFVIDTATETHVDTIEVGPGARGLEVSPDGSAVYVGNVLSNDVSVIDTASREVVTTIPVGNSPFSVAFSPTGDRAYVSNVFSNDVTVIDTAEREVLTSVAVGGGPEHLAVSPDGGFVYVCEGFADSVAVIDTETNAVVDRVPVGAFPFGIAFSPDGALAYVTNYFDKSISVIDTSTRLEVDLINLSVFPEFLVDGPREITILPIECVPAPPTPTITATPTVTPTPTVTAPPTATLTPTETTTPLSTATATATESPTSTPSPTYSRSVTVTPTSSPTPTRSEPMPTVVPCAGDCNRDGRVTIEELILAVAMALGRREADCDAVDRNQNGIVSVDEIVAAVTKVLSGCSEVRATGAALEKKRRALHGVTTSSERPWANRVFLCSRTAPTSPARHLSSRRPGLPRRGDTRSLSVTAGTRGNPLPGSAR